MSAVTFNRRSTGTKRTPSFAEVWDRNLINAIDRAVAPATLGDYIKVKYHKGTKISGDKNIKAATEAVKAVAMIKAYEAPVSSNSNKDKNIKINEPIKNTSPNLVVTNDGTNWPGLGPAPKVDLTPPVQISLPMDSAAHARWQKLANLIANMYHKADETFFDDSKIRDRFFKHLHLDIDDLLDHYKTVRDLEPEDVKLSDMQKKILLSSKETYTEEMARMAAEAVVVKNTIFKEEEKAIAANVTLEVNWKDIVATLKAKKDKVQSSVGSPTSKNADIAPPVDWPIVIQSKKDDCVPIEPARVFARHSWKDAIESKNNIISAELLVKDDAKNWPSLRLDKPPVVSASMLSGSVVIYLPGEEPAEKLKYFTPTTMATYMQRHSMDADCPDMTVDELAELLVSCGPYADYLEYNEIIDAKGTKIAPTTSISSKLVPAVASLASEASVKQDAKVDKQSKAAITRKVISAIPDIKFLFPKTATKQESKIDRQSKAVTITDTTPMASIKANSKVDKPSTMVITPEVIPVIKGLAPTAVIKQESKVDEQLKAVITSTTVSAAVIKEESNNQWKVVTRTKAIPAIKLVTPTVAIKDTIKIDKQSTIVRTPKTTPVIKVLATKPVIQKKTNKQLKAVPTPKTSPAIKDTASKVATKEVSTLYKKPTIVTTPKIILVTKVLASKVSIKETSDVVKQSKATITHEIVPATKVTIIKPTAKENVTDNKDTKTTITTTIVNVDASKESPVTLSGPETTVAAIETVQILTPDVKPVVPNKAKLNRNELSKAEKAKKKAANEAKHKAKAAEEKIQQQLRKETRLVDEKARILAAQLLKAQEKEAELLAEKLLTEQKASEESQRLYRAAQLNHLAMQTSDMATQNNFIATGVNTIVDKEDHGLPTIIKPGSPSKAEIAEARFHQQIMDTLDAAVATIAAADAAKAAEQEESRKYAIASLESNDLCPIAWVWSRTPDRMEPDYLRPVVEDIESATQSIKIVEDTLAATSSNLIVQGTECVEEILAYTSTDPDFVNPIAWVWSRSPEDMEPEFPRASTESEESTKEDNQVSASQETTDPSLTEESSNKNGTPEKEKAITDTRTTSDSIKVQLPPVNLSVIEISTPTTPSSITLSFRPKKPETLQWTVPREYIERSVDDYRVDACGRLELIPPKRNRVASEADSQKFENYLGTGGGIKLPLLQFNKPKEVSPTDLPSSEKELPSTEVNEAPDTTVDQELLADSPQSTDAAIEAKASPTTNSTIIVPQIDGPNTPESDRKFLSDTIQSSLDAQTQKVLAPLMNNANPATNDVLEFMSCAVAQIDSTHGSMDIATLMSGLHQILPNKNDLTKEEKKVFAEKARMLAMLASAMALHAGQMEN